MDAIDWSCRPVPVRNVGRAIGEGVRPAPSRRRVWLATAAGVIVAGTIGSLLSASALARDDGQKSRSASETSSIEIASTLTLAIQHEQDLGVSADAFVIGTPAATQTQFLQWTSDVRAFARYPELQEIGEFVLVPASRLSAFAAHALENTTGPLAVHGTFQVNPAGDRPYYCLATLLQPRSAQQVSSAGIDVCDTELGPKLIDAEDSGLGAYLPYGTGKTAQLVVETPVYQGGAVPTTVSMRRAAFIGWVGTEVTPSIVLKTALKSHPDTTVALRYKDGSTDVTFEAGKAPIGARSTTIDLHNGWQVQVLETVTEGTVQANPNAAGLLLGGIVLTLLVGLLIYVLGTGRSRAVLLVSERTDQLRHQALHDSLTGLPNRALILDRIGQMLARARRQHTPTAALFLDLDNFKDINDTLGHEAGDQLLAAVGARLAGVLRDGDTVGRLGGDEFVVLVEDASLAAGSEVVVSRILDVLETPFEIPGSEVPLSVTASIGVAEGDRTTPDELLRDADIALYRAKAAGKQRAVLFSQSMQDDVDDHRHLEVDLHSALETDQFFLMYQPTFNLSTGLFTGVEALLRWRHPQRGVVLPDDFIPALETSGLIIPVGRWVLHEACRQGALWNRQGYRFAVSVNVSARQLERDGIADEVRDALAVSGFDPRLLILELTESALMHDVDATVAQLKIVKESGVRIAIDDFGTGYSSLAYLRQFPIDVLKIDRSFVSGISNSPESAAIVHTLIQLGKVLGLRIIAEGIETDDQRVRLTAEDVDIGQGFLFARPLDVADVDGLLQSSIGMPEMPLVVA